MVKGDRGFEAAEIRALLDGAGAQLKAMILLGITRLCLSNRKSELTESKKEATSLLSNRFKATRR